MREDRSDRLPQQSIAVEPYAWRIWRNYRGGRAVAGNYRNRREADRGVVQLARLYKDSTLSIEFIGRPIGHADIGGRSL